MKRRAVMLGLVAFLLLWPTAAAQWIDDDDGDAEGYASNFPVPHGRSGAAEIFDVEMEETSDAFRITVHHADSPSPTLPFFDGAGYDIDFNHGAIAYRLAVYLDSKPSGSQDYRALLHEGQSNGDLIARPPVETVENGFRVTLQKELIPDELGAFPVKGAILSEVSISSQTQSTIYVCTGPGCNGATPYAVDRAPDTGTSSYTIVHGLVQDGDIRLTSDAPVRWSNGEATTFVYEVRAMNLGSEKDFITFQASNVPTGWQISEVNSTILEPGESILVPLAVRVPFAHAHGTDPRFILDANGAAGTGRLEMGVHYPAIPQPTGHHSLMTIHTRSVEHGTVTSTLNPLRGQNVNSVAFMNTASEDEFDENIPVPGNKIGYYEGGFGSQLDDGTIPEMGVPFSWIIRLSPALRMGLETNPELIGDGTIALAFDAAIGEVDIRGRISVVDSNEVQAASTGSSDSETVVAVVEGTSRATVAGTVELPVFVTANNTTIPYGANQELVLYLDAIVYRPGSPVGPNEGVYLTGGEFMFPLMEYHDAVPVSLELPLALEQEAVLGLDSQPSQEESQGAPSAGGIFVIFALVTAAFIRRNI